jgi:hypothetical protein
MAKIKKTKNDIEFLFGSLNEKKAKAHVYLQRADAK